MNNGEAIALQGEVTQSDFAKKLIDTTVKQFGDVNIIVNNAGYTWDSLLHKMTGGQFQVILDIHLIGPFRLIREAAPYFRNKDKK